MLRWLVDSFGFNGSLRQNFSLYRVKGRGMKTFSMLDSAEHGILNAQKCENIKKLGIFQARISLECYFSCS